jgi:threonylcarbamoyladenosine tRNA methylthiotransferase MtaB
LEKSVAFYTLGCKVNQYETEAVLEIFQNNGYNIVDFREMSDVYVINTCTVTNVSDRKSRQMIRKAKLNNSKAIVVMMGCYSQVSADEAKKLEDVDIIIGSTGKNKIMEYIDNYKQKKERLVFVEDLKKEKKFDDFSINTYKDNTRAYVKIQDGCNRYCSYCIIPYARGEIRSRDYKSVLEEVERLSHEGFKEVILTGLHLASYGKDKKDIDLLELVKKIVLVPRIERIRLGSLEPVIIDKKFIEVAKNTKKLCKHFHLSLQSGSDSVLKRMNRRYTTKEYYEKVKLIKDNIPGVSLTTDIIVGFPGETNEEFDETMNFIESVGFLKVHVFKFSARKGTKAAEFTNKVNPVIKDKRSKEAIQIVDKMSLRFKENYIGKKIDIIIEQEVSDKKGYLIGTTDNYLKVIVEGNIDIYKGKICNVKLRKIVNGYIEADFV